MLINDLIKQGGRIIGVEREFRGTLSARGTLSVGPAVAREGKKGTRRGQAQQEGDRPFLLLANARCANHAWPLLA